MNYKRRTISSDVTMHKDRCCAALVALLILSALALYLAGAPGNPPGFFVDESSIAYNAHLIARTGADEHGARWPLFFRAFGEYKSPVYIYLLAALYSLTGPSITTARVLSAALGAAGALMLGLVAAQTEKDEEQTNTPRTVGLVVAALALVTPWLYETSRLVFEVALMPLALALMLLALRTAHARGLWLWRDSLAMASTLALVTYTYSVGRLLAPLFALGLLFFAPRGGWLRVVLRTWALYAATLLPLLFFVWTSPGALGERFAHVTFIRPEMSWGKIVLRFFQNYFANFNLWSWLIAGDPEPRHHLPVMGSLLVGAVLLSALGIFVVVRERRNSAWWRFILYGLAVSALPSALTLDHFHTLRLVALPVFLLMLAAPAAAWLVRRTNAQQARARRFALIALLLLTIAQGAVFQFHFHRARASRAHNFDAFYGEIFEAALSRPERPIHIIDGPGAPGYMHAYWQATLRGIDAQQFVRLSKEQRAPSGALVISTEVACDDCRMILQRGGFRLFIAN